MSIYLDAVWLLNFLLDYMLLSLTNKLTKLNTKFIRIVIGAFVASLIVPLSIYFPNSFMTTFPAKVIYSIVIILATFGFKNIFQLAKLLFMFYFLSFSIGGGLIAIHFFMQNPVTIANTGFLTHHTGFGDPISWLFVIIGFPIVWLFTKRRMDKHVQEKIRYDAIYSITLQIKGKRHQTDGYVDSGNQLVDPFTKKPVIICDEAFLQAWFEKEEWEQLQQAFENWEMDCIPKNWIDAIVVIPYQGVEGGGGFIFAIKPELLLIDYEQKQIQTTSFLVGIQFGQLTKDARYHCLLQPELIQAAIEYSA